MGRVRGSFRHHEPYLLASSLARALESLFDELPAGSSRLVCERLTTLVDGNVLLGSVATHCTIVIVQLWRPSGGLVLLFSSKVAVFVRTWTCGG